MKKEIIGIDGFCGGGGASHGLKRAGIHINIAINHNQAAILLHEISKDSCKKARENMLVLPQNKIPGQMSFGDTLETPPGKQGSRKRKK